MNRDTDMSAFGSERDGHGQACDVLPASQYLQERLQERRSRNTRPRRSRHTDLGPQKGRDDDIFLNEAEANRRSRMFDSSPLAASTRSSEAGGSGRRRALGARDMDDQLDRLSKQNFALKLELDHRREQTQRLQEENNSMRAQVERAELLEDEHRELLKLNTQMVEELERRDKAIEEAMDIICQLEDRVADMDERNSNTRPSTANADSGYAGTETQEHDVQSSPPQLQPKTPRVSIRPPSQPASAASQKLQGLVASPTPARPRREPSFLSQQKPSTNALRSVYMENAKELRPVKSFQSLLSRQEGRIEEEDGLSSPRLSVLSESSFPSLYSPKDHLSPDHHTWEDAENESVSASQSRPRSHLRQDSIKRVSQWISDRDAADATPSKSNSISTPLIDESEHSTVPPPRHGSQELPYQSLNHTLVSASRRSPELSQYPDGFNPFDPRARKIRSPQSRPTSFAGPIFGEPLLPPTPDSASTRMLRASRSSIIDERSLLDVTPAVSKGYKALQSPIEPNVRTAPRQMRSSVELRTALASNMEFRNQILDGLRNSDNVPNEDATDADGYSEAVHGLRLEDDEFPDGQSIHMGTPRRLLKHAKPAVLSNLADSAELPSEAVYSPPRRRRSSDQYASHHTKPRLTRVETSPTMVGSLGMMMSGSKKLSAESMTSPRSVHSSSSGNRTIVYADDQHRRAISPEAFASRVSPPPSRTLSQKARTLVRRLSNSHNIERERGPPPTFQSLPVSTGTPIELRRPRTSHALDRPPSSPDPSAMPRSPSAREQRRPSLPFRTKTEPPTGRPPSSATERSMQGSDKEKKSFFKRSNSVKMTDSMADPNNRSGVTKRRGSLRDAVTTARRPWR